MFYVLNKNGKSSNHKIHTCYCTIGPHYKNTIVLGNLENFSIAKYKAQKYYPNVNGCKYCCKE